MPIAHYIQNYIRTGIWQNEILADVPTRLLTVLKKWNV